MEKYHKIKLYKDNIIKFIISQNNENIKNTKFNDIDYIVGILFLTEMNRYCKINKITIHGYYIAYSLINLFKKIRKKLISNSKISCQDINFFWLSIASNIEYLNSRVEENNLIKNKINQNVCKLIIELSSLLDCLVGYNKNHNTIGINMLENNLIKNSDSNNNLTNYSSFTNKSNNSNLSNNTNKSSNSNSDNTDNLENLNNQIIQTDISNMSLTKNYLSNDKIIYCDNKCYLCWVDNILCKFFYILLILAKFIGSGETKDPNLIKLSEYYANIFYTYIKIIDLGRENLNNTNSYELFDNYIEFKNKLNYSLIELKLNSDTVDEIVKYIDNTIIANLSIR